VNYVKVAQGRVSAFVIKLMNLRIWEQEHFLNSLGSVNYLGTMDMFARVLHSIVSILPSACLIYKKK
jgi:hypothetical protein